MANGLEVVRKGRVVTVTAGVYTRKFRLATLERAKDLADRLKNDPDYRAEWMKQWTPLAAEPGVDPEGSAPSST